LVSHLLVLPFKDFKMTNYGNLTPIGLFSTASSMGGFVSMIVDIITIVSGLYFLINFAMGGLGYATGGGDDKELAKARKTITNSLIGFILVVSAYFVVGYVGKRLLGSGSDIFTPKLEGGGVAIPAGQGCFELTYNNTGNQLIQGNSYSFVVTENCAGNPIIAGSTFAYDVRMGNTLRSGQLIFVDRGCPYQGHLKNITMGTNINSYKVVASGAFGGKCAVYTN